MFEKIKGKEVLVVGLARSGLAAVKLLCSNGAAAVTVTDQKEPALLENELAILSSYPQVKTVVGENPPELVTPSLSMIIKSPGVPPDLEIFKKAAALEVAVYSEIELAYSFIKAPIIGVTGTNGKTTTTALITAILKEARFNPVVSAGNIGNPLSGIIGNIDAQGMVVAELSSFQLQDINLFRPAVAVIINFAEDHIDYHGSVNDYYRAKARILENQVKGDYAVLNAADEAVAALEQEVKGNLIWFDRKPVSAGIGIESDKIMLYKPDSEPVPICSRKEIALPGEHNLENALAASATAWAAGADLPSIETILRSFQAIEHRLEAVDIINGVEYINDSKGTNPGATIKALQSFPGRGKILIAGGKYKGGDFGQLASFINREIRYLLLIGESSEKIAQAVEAVGFSNYTRVKSLEEAVAIAAQKAVTGEVVLLSPACASWDMFKDYEERGNYFKTMVNALKRKKDGDEETGHG